MLALRALGARVTLVAPPTLLPPSLEGWAVEVDATPSTTCCPKLDVAYLLRMQLERQEQALVPILREYTALLRPHARAGRAGCPGTRWSCTPGR